MDGVPLPLNTCRVLKKNLIINRFYMLLNGLAIILLFYYRATTFLCILRTNEVHVLPYSIIIISELLLTFLWTLHQAYRWKPVERTVYPERLPEDEQLPAVDVFICTVDPSFEPTLGVMNTVISAMALDYPPDKLAVYLSDDGRSSVTLFAIQEAWKFSKVWLPFCRKYGLKNRCPQSYFSSSGDGMWKDGRKVEFEAEKIEMQLRYNDFKETLERRTVDAGISISRDHPPLIKVMGEEGENPETSSNRFPILVYVAREKRPSHPHHFKAGALNVLVRVSAVISNAPYLLILDCDHYCNDPTSARQAMCFHLDAKISSNLAFVQFPQKFHNVGNHDIHDNRLQYYYRRWSGFDGVGGPPLSGCDLYLKREALYGSKSTNTNNEIDMDAMKKSFGSSNELIKTICKKTYRPYFTMDRNSSHGPSNEVELLASCSYENQTEWGNEVGYNTFSVTEDIMTSLILHSRGWTSVFINPRYPCFIGSSTDNLNDFLVQRSRWGLGLIQIFLSKYCPLVYGTGKMLMAQCMCYASLTSDAMYSFPFYGLAIVPQICLLRGIPLYPKVSDPYCILFAFIFVSSQLKHVQDVLSYGDSFSTALFELRIWMMKCASSYLYASYGVVLDKFGLQQANFTLTSKIFDNEQSQMYKDGVYNFQVVSVLIGPICTLYILNVIAFVVGFSRIIQTEKVNELFVQGFIPFFGIIVNYHLLEGMLLRKDKGRVSPWVVLASMVTAFTVALGSSILV